MDSGGRRTGIKRQHPLLFQRAERTTRSRRHHENVTALLNNAQFLQRHGRSAKLLFQQSNRSPHAQRRDSIGRELLKSAERHEIAETVESFSPTRQRLYQFETLPIPQTARLYPQDAPNLSPRVSL